MTEPQASAIGITGRISLRTLIIIRWIAVAGQLSAVLLVQYALGYDLPIASCLAVIGVSVLLNLAASLQSRSRLRLGERDALLYLAYDVLQLSVLLFLTGGLQNPFVVLLLAPLTVSAIILSQRGTLAMTGLTLVCLSVLAVWQYPVPGADGASDFVPMAWSAVYKLGVWFALALSAVFVTAYVWQVADEARRFADALSASQMALAREQQLSALGALAAAAAHELGTPLSTIAVVARELSREIPPDSPLAEDIELLHAESKRCRDILEELARRPETDGGDPFDLLTLSALIETAAEPHQAFDVALEVETVPRDASRPPTVRRTPEVVHGLGNLLQNAVQFGRSRVSVRAEWSRDDVVIIITDDGPGFPQNLLSRLGEPYLSGREASEDADDRHMGLGIFIAVTLLDRSGARIRFGNARNGGAQVVVRWKRHIFERERR